MIITSEVLDGMFRGFSTAFNSGFAGAPTQYAEIAMMAPSVTAETTYAWLGQLPRLREWIGERHIKNLVAHGYSIKNKDFESTIGVPRNAIADDQYGVFGPMFNEMGRQAAEHPDELIFSLLAAGFTTPCYDRQYFFDTDHPVSVGTEETSVSNMQGGAGPAWYLMDTSRAIKPLIWQKREEYSLARKDSDSDDNVFFKNEYLYGSRGRGNAGFGLWQLAYASKAALNADNYKLGRNAMQALRGDEGRLLGISPKVLVVPPELEEDGLKLLNAEYLAAGESNVWKGTAKLIVSPWLAE